MNILVRDQRPRPLKKRTRLTSTKRESSYTDASNTSTNNGPVVRSQRAVDFVEDETASNFHALRRSIVFNLVETSHGDLNAIRGSKSGIGRMSATLDLWERRQ